MKPYLFTEAIKVKDGVFYNPDAHIKRMQQTSLHFFGKSTIFSLSEEQIPMDKRDGLFKCRIVYNASVTSIEFIPYTFRNINKLTLIDGSGIDYNHKWVDRSRFDQLLTSKGDGDDLLIIKNGLVTDTSFSNVVFENEDGLYTPNSYLLNGTKRQHLLSRGIIKERTIKEEDIHLYSRIHIINAMIDLEDDISLSTSELRRIGNANP